MTTTYQPENSKLSVWGFCLALLSLAFISSSALVFVGLPMPIVSIILCALGLKDIRKNRKGGKFFICADRCPWRIDDVGIDLASFRRNVTQSRA